MRFQKLGSSACCRYAVSVFVERSGLVQCNCTPSNTVRHSPCSYEALNKRALHDADLFAKTGRIRTPSPPALSEEDVVILERLSNSIGVSSKSKKRADLGMCKCAGKKGESAPPVPEKGSVELLREAHLVLCVGQVVEEERRTTVVVEKSEPSLSPSGNTLQGTDSEFVLGDSEPVSEDTSGSSRSKEDSFDESGNSEERRRKATKNIPIRFKSLHSCMVILHVHTCATCSSVVLKPMDVCPCCILK